MSRNWLTVKDLYTIFMSQVTSLPLVVAKYPSIEFDKHVWPNIHNCFVDANLRDLSWRTAHDIVPTNYLLYKRRVRRSFECAICKSDCERVTHLCITCPVVRPLWVFLFDLASRITGVELVRLTIAADIGLLDRSVVLRSL